MDSRCWDDFCGDVKALLDVGATTVQGVIEEALRALREQPTILVVEELSKVSKDVFRHTWQSPAEAACSFEDVEPQEFEVSLMDAYRHELCTCTRFENTALLFTAVSFGMMYSDINEDAEDSAELDSHIADVVRQTGDPSVVERLLLSSSTSSRRGSPYFLLNAVEIGFLDTEILAGRYFLPTFRDAVIRTSLPANLTHIQPDVTSARAFARLSGGHARSAGFLRKKLVDAIQPNSSPVWSTVVLPAAMSMASQESLTELLNDLLASPVILVAALHNCEVDSQLPIIQGDLSKRYFKGWDDLFSTGVLSCGLQGTSGTYKNPCIPPLYLVALLERWGPWQTEVALPGAGPAATDAIYMRGIMHALKELFHTYDGKGDASSVWEYVSLWSEVVLTRIRLAARWWAAASPGLTLPHDYRSLTLSNLYPGTRSYYSDGPRPLLDQERFNALPDSMIVVDEGDLVDISGILALQAADLLRTSFKCKHSQVGGDYIKFLRRSGAVEGLKNEELVSKGELEPKMEEPRRDELESKEEEPEPKKEELVAVFKSCKCTGNAGSRFNVDKHVRKSLRLMETAFGSSWEEWRTKTVLVVDTNLKIAKNPSTRLTPEESRMVIIIGAENHLDVYGRSLSGFFADAPTLFAATVAKRSGKRRRV